MEKREWTMSNMSLDEWHEEVSDTIELILGDWRECYSLEFEDDEYRATLKVHFPLSPEFEREIRKNNSEWCRHCEAEIQIYEDSYEPLDDATLWRALSSAALDVITRLEKMIERYRERETDND